MENVVIYGPPNSSYAWSARMTVIEKGLPLETVNVMPHSDEMLERHPFGKVPAMQHGNVRLFETSAIMRYLAEGYDTGTALIPEGLVERAVMEQWVSAVNDTFYDAIMHGLCLPRIFKVIQGTEFDPEELRAALPLISHRLDILNRELDNRAYLAGDAVSLADLLLIPQIFTLALMPEGDDFLHKRPNLLRWQKAMATRSAFIQTMPPLAEDHAIIDAMREEPLLVV